ncbi:MAG: hypothetical protein M1296_01405 [Chloroflexi bacterium]|nr:hypothetical protein [Chloroflexota bacterium]
MAADRARVILGASAALLAVLLTLPQASRFHLLVPVLLALLPAILVPVALWRNWTSLFFGAIGLLGVTYVFSLRSMNGVFDTAALLYGWGLWLCAECGQLALSLQWIRTVQPPVWQRRALLSLAVTLATAGLTLLLLAAAELPLTGTLVLRGAGVLAIIGTLAIVISLLARVDTDPVRRGRRQ